MEPYLLAGCIPVELDAVMESPNRGMVHGGPRRVFKDRGGGAITISQSDHQNDPRNKSNTRYLRPSVWDGYSVVGIPSNPRGTLHTDRINRDRGVAGSHCIHAAKAVVG